LPFVLRHFFIRPSSFIIPTVPESLDLNLYRLNVSGGHTLPTDAPGLAALGAPRKAARGREKDSLCLCLSLRARHSEDIPPTLYAELLDLAAATFFGSPGSVTSALRQALNAANQNLLNYNLRQGASGSPVQGGLICAALRGTDFYAVQSGPGLILVLHGETLERFPNAPSRPLGLSNTLEAQYFHTVVQEREYFALSNQAIWDEAALAGSGSLATLSAVVARFKASTTADVAALIGRFEPAGTTSLQPAAGIVTTPSPTLPHREVQRWGRGLQPRVEADKPSEVASPPVPTSAPPAIPPPAAVPVTPPSEAVAPTPVSAPPPEPSTSGTDWSNLLKRAERLGQSDPTPAIPTIQETPPTPVAQRSAPSPIPAAPPEPEDNPPEAGASPRRRSSKESPPVRTSSRAIGNQIKESLQSIGRALGTTITEGVRGLRILIARMLPEGTLQKDGLFVIPTPVQIGIVVGVPLLIFVVVAALYIQRGQPEQFAATLDQARLEVEAARLSADALEARPHWETALLWLDKADKLRAGNSEAATLRQEAQGQLDELDWVTRLDYQPLLTQGLGRNVKVVQILLAGQEVYALDETRNRIVRITPTPSGSYALDPTFECSGGALGDKTIGPLLDIGLIPGPNAIAETDAVVGLDTTGALLYCAPGLKPLATYLPTPDTSWIRPAALEVYADRLYILDPGGNEAWQFLASGGAFIQPPTHYFTSVVYDLSQVIEFSIAQGDLFLLHKDGKISNCTRPTGAATCVEAMSFTDTRLGRVSGDHLAEVTTPRRLVYDPPPEPSLYLLDANTGAVYQLSLKLVLVRQFRPLFPFGSPATAVAVDTAKRLFVAAGDNIYIGARP
jgi:hypothetical protein